MTLKRFARKIFKLFSPDFRSTLVHLAFWFATSMYIVEKNVVWSFFIASYWLTSDEDK